MKKFHTLTGEPKNATWPLQSSRILSKARKISLLGWWMVTTTARPVSARTWRRFRISREEAESNPRGVCVAYQGREGRGKEEAKKRRVHESDGAINK